MFAFSFLIMLFVSFFPSEISTHYELLLSEVMSSSLRSSIGPSALHAHPRVVVLRSSGISEGKQEQNINKRKDKQQDKVSQLNRNTLHHHVSFFSFIFLPQ